MCTHMAVDTGEIESIVGNFICQLYVRNLHQKCYVFILLNLTVKR